MTFDIITILPWILSIFTVLHQYLAGSKSKFAWPLAFLTELCWLVWSISAEIWGLIPMSIFLSIVYIRNITKK